MDPDEDDKICEPTTTMIKYLNFLGIKMFMLSLLVLSEGDLENYDITARNPKPGFENSDGPLAGKLFKHVLAFICVYNISYTYS